MQWPSSAGGNDHWYGIIPVVQNWLEHKAQAESYEYDGYQGHLVTITSPEENQFIYNNILVGNTNQPSISDQFFIGGFKNGSWDWITSEPFVYANWAGGEPNGDGPAMSIWGASNGSKSGFWNDVPHDGAPTSIYRIWSIVEFGNPSTSPNTDTLINLVQWPSSAGGNDHWYGIIPVVQNWLEHKAQAESYEYDGYQGHLVTITSPEENQFIYNNILVGNTNQPSISDQFFIGGFKNGSWDWITSEAFVYANWAGGEPNGDGPAMSIWGASNGSKSGFWNDVPHDGAPTSIYRIWSIVEFDEFSSQMEIYVDVKPGSCPNPVNAVHDRRNNAVVPVSILGTEDFDINQIDFSSVKINGVPALRWTIEDVGTPLEKVDNCDCTEEGADGYLDVLFKFNRNDIINTVLPENPSVSKGSPNNTVYDKYPNENNKPIREEKILILTGNLLDGTPVIGYDCIKLFYRNNYSASELDKSPLEYRLIGNHPNPFNPVTNISYTIPYGGYVKLQIYNIQGQLVSTLVNDYQEAGNHIVQWDANNYSSGIYFYKLQTAEYQETKKMILLK